MSACLIGDCRDSMRQLIAHGRRVQMCVTSPPYFGLRDYGVDGQLGLEATPQEFVANMVEVFSLVRDLLADDGTLWLNMGDSYAGSRSDLRVVGLKPKDLMGMPWRLAFALQADGWYLRQDILWHKPNPMPESVTDRCTKAHEYLFLLSKSERYFWDYAAMQERACAADIGAMDGGAQRLRDGSNANDGRNFRVPGNVNPPKGQRAYEMGDESHRTKAGLLAYSFKRKTQTTPPPRQPDQHREDREDVHYVGTRNRRSVWTVATTPYSGAHFATFPPALIEPCILAGSRPGDTVLDPFFGSGTTGQVAQRLGRQWIGCELNPAYVELQERRTAQIGMEL